LAQARQHQGRSATGRSSRGVVWVKTGNALIEHKISAVVAAGLSPGIGGSAFAHTVDGASAKKIFIRRHPPGLECAHERTRSPILPDSPASSPPPWPGTTSNGCASRPSSRWYSRASWPGRTPSSPLTPASTRSSSPTTAGAPTRTAAPPSRRWARSSRRRARCRCWSIPASAAALTWSRLLLGRAGLQPANVLRSAGRRQCHEHDGGGAQEPRQPGPRLPSLRLFAFHGQEPTPGHRLHRCPFARRFSDSAQVIDVRQAARPARQRRPRR
jgi:hypothetical protein